MPAAEWAARFRARVDSSAGPDACWPWVGARGGEGYGHLEINRRSRRAHRVAWELAHGRVPDGLVVCHACDNPPCCNPTHLWLGTRADNNRDRAAKGRSASGDRHATHRVPDLWRGERQWAAKLNRDQVRAIRAAHAAGATQLGLSRQYGVSRRAVKSILTRQTWGWLP